MSKPYRTTLQTLCLMGWFFFMAHILLNSVFDISFRQGWSGTLLLFIFSTLFSFLAIAESRNKLTKG